MTTRLLLDTRDLPDPPPPGLVLAGKITAGAGLIAILCLLVIGLFRVQDLSITVEHDQRANTHSLCALRGDLQARVTAGNNFLATHPNGIPGISAATLSVSIANEQSTIDALSNLVCRTP